MDLTREQAIEGHRKMYNDMADEIEQSKKLINVGYFKMEYCKKNRCTLIHNYCFACEYSKGDCIDCPIEWESSVDELMCLDKEKYEDDHGYYSLLCDAIDWQEQAALARKIANLPERTDV